MPDPATLAEVRDLLATPHTVAVIGAHHETHRPAHYVPAYLYRRGWRVLPVNPTLVGMELFGEPVVAQLADLTVPVDVVNVFRRSSDVPRHLDDVLALSPRPAVVWLQQGIRHEDVAEALRAQGIRVIQDRCMLADHKGLGLS